jgi:hypothetical protein
MRHHGLDVDAPDCFRSLVVPRRIRYDVARMEATLKQLIHNRLDAEGADGARLSTAMPVAEPPGAYLR